MFNILLKRRYSDRRALPRTKPSREKTQNKTPNKNPANHWEILYRVFLSGLVLLLKTGGSEMC